MLILFILLLKLALPESQPVQESRQSWAANFLARSYKPLTLVGRYPSGFG